ncbi:hypothetical protein QO010_001409 [Caulobacter ginsengisoli]|uniref:DUF2087 domain-containing protein n=1 Tax=Caulobacter ginsengisoli TaxID=400775 RepID=A0ABU0INP9_9CAUL|nr:DUF2087 domain-containing protein [Caulobacter ginsengisoli]MDQ0463638.1 hypothetical protein [Caulobacter ginsengisoli]
MSRVMFPYAVNDISALAKSMSRELGAAEGRPGHVQLLNMLARAAGYRNYQHFRAGAEGTPEQPPPAPIADQGLVERVARHFDSEGRLLRWPSRDSHVRLALWALWARLEAGAVHTEREISAVLKTLHVFGDHALLRRALVDYGLVTRTADCRDYRRIEQPPPADALALIRRLASSRH